MGYETKSTMFCGKANTIDEFNKRESSGYYIFSRNTSPLFVVNTSLYLFNYLLNRQLKTGFKPNQLEDQTNQF